MVHLSKRSKSPYKYVSIPLDIESLTWEICDIIPKRHTFKMTNELFAIARNIVKYTQYADDVILNVAKDYEDKIRLLKLAYRECDYFFSQMGILYERVPIKDKLITDWSSLVDEEMDKLNYEVRRAEKAMSKCV